jgi:hypothetical protein
MDWMGSFEVGRDGAQQNNLHAHDQNAPSPNYCDAERNATEQSLGYF